MGNSRTRIARMLRFLERLLLLIAVVSIGFYAGVRVAAAREQASLSHELDYLTRLEALAARPGAKAARPEATATKPGRAPGGSIWRIEVPRINLSAAAREGVDARTLRGAVGHIPGTALPGEYGNAGFAAHRDTFFAPLRSVRRGDEVIVTTPLGVYRYAVTGTRIVEPDDLTVLDPSSEAVLTLVTCYPFNYVGSAPQRFIVRAALRTTSPARTH